MGFIANLFVREDRFAVLLEAATLEVMATVKALDEVASTLQGMVVGLRGGGSIGTAKQHNDVLQGIKGDADMLCSTAQRR